MSTSEEILLSEFRDVEIVEDLRSILNVITRSMAIPLYLLFWIADIVYVPQYKWQFLGFRLCIVPLCLGARHLIFKIQSPFWAQLLCATHAGLVALPINIMIYYIADIGTGYYAGLNLVAIGGLSFLPLTMNFFILGTLIVYFPYYLIVMSKATSIQALSLVFINSFFIVSSIIVCFVIRNYNENMRLRELNLRLALNLEITMRTKKELALMARELND